MAFCVLSTTRKPARQSWRAVWVCRIAAGMPAASHLPARSLRLTRMPCRDAKVGSAWRSRNCPLGKVRRRRLNVLGGPALGTIQTIIWLIGPRTPPGNVQPLPAASRARALERDRGRDLVTGSRREATAAPERRPRPLNEVAPRSRSKARARTSPQGEDWAEHPTYNREKAQEVPTPGDMQRPGSRKTSTKTCRSSSSHLA